MSTIMRDFAVLRYRAAGSRLPWSVRHGSVLSGPTAPPTLGVQSVRWPMAAWRRLYQPLLTRACVAALVLMPFCIAACAFTGTYPLEQSLAALVLALVVSTVQILVDPYIAARPRTEFLAQGVASAAFEAQARIAEPVVTLLPEPNIGKAFDDMVRRALTHLCDPTKLSLSPLLQLSLITVALQEQGLEDTRLQRVAILKTLLTGLVQSLRPQQRSDGCAGAAHRFYNCLYYPYVRGITRRSAPAVLRRLRERRERDGGPHTEEERVVEWLLQVNEDTYYKWQRRASDTISLILRERENVVAGFALQVSGHLVSA